MITADEARALNPQHARDAYLTQLGFMIEEAAKAGSFSLRVPYVMCEANGYDAKFKAPGIEEALVEAGFLVQARSEECQFVDVWLEISWEKEADDDG